MAEGISLLFLLFTAGVGAMAHVDDIVKAVLDNLRTSV